MPPAPRQAARRVAAVSRALAVMDALAAGGELGTNEIARRTGVNASTVSRLLATLASSGYVDQAANGRYRLGIRLVQLGNAVVDRLDLRELSRPELERLVADVGETATLSVAGGYEAVTVDFVQSPSSVQGVAQLGRPSVAHATATGKVLLAFGGIGLPPGAAASLHGAHDRRPARARAGDRARPLPRLGGRRRGARGGPRRDRRPRPGKPRRDRGDHRRAGPGRPSRREGSGGRPRAAARVRIGTVAPARLGRGLTSVRRSPTRRGSRHRARSAASPCGACGRGSATDPVRGRAGLARARPRARAARRPVAGIAVAAARPRHRASGRAPRAREATPRRPAARSCRSRARARTAAGSTRRR